MDVNGRVTDIDTLAATAEDLLNEICLDSLETTLDALISPRSGAYNETQQVSALFIGMADTVRALVEHARTLERNLATEMELGERWRRERLAAEARADRYEKAIRFYAALGPDDIPYADTINDPPDIGRVARAALDGEDA